jgi:DUF438 domain-containing protein
MKLPGWTKEFSASINICDKNGVLLYLNNKAVKTLEKDGGEKLIGTNIIDCHPGESRKKFEDMLSNASTNAYMIEKNGIRKFIYQAPWYENGEYMGIVELVMEIPSDLPLHQRK